MNFLANVFIVYLSIYICKKISEPIKHIQDIEKFKEDFYNQSYLQNSTNFFNNICSMNMTEYKKVIENDFLNNTKVLLSHHISNNYLFLDFEKIGCYDLEKVAFVKYSYDNKVDYEIKSRNLVFQTIYHTFNFFNDILIIIYFILSVPSLLYIHYFC